MTSKGNLLVHLGAPKTGTTSIQTKLDSETFNLAQHGWIYPKYGRSKQVPAAHHNLAYECDGKLTTKSRFDPVLGSWSSVLEEIEKSCLDGIISSEALYFMGAQGIENLSRILMDYNTELVFYFRRQDRWLISQWNQRLRFGRTSLNFLTFMESHLLHGRYDLVLSRWRKFFPKSKFRVYLFDSIGNIVPHFFYSILEIEDFTASASTKKNNKAGIKQLYVAKLIRDCISQLINNINFSLNMHDVEVISQFFRMGGDLYDFCPITYSQAEELFERFEPHNQIIYQASNDRFLPPERADYNNLVDIETTINMLTDEEKDFIDNQIQRILRRESKLNKLSTTLS